MTLLVALGAQACTFDTQPDCADCGRIVIVAVGEPASIVPPLVQETVGRDIGGLIYEPLLRLRGGGVPADSSAWIPALAEGWEGTDSTVTMTLRAGARWHGGLPVTAEDVVFSHGVYADTAVGAPGLPALDGIRVEALDARTVRFSFAAGRPSPLYDIAYGIRILPKHRWAAKSPASWPAETDPAQFEGSGPYRLQIWQRGQYLRLVADTAAAIRAATDTLVWRFAADPTAAATLLLAHEADVMETLITPANTARVTADSTLRVERYPSAAYGFLAFQVADRTGRPSRFVDLRLRQALGFALDRQTIATAVYGPGTAVPHGPVSQALWLHDAARPVQELDTVGAAALLDAAGWRRGADGMRRRGDVPLDVEILVPATSSARSTLAQAIVAQWRSAGIAGTVASVDFPVFQQRLAEGRFDTYIGSYLDEPSPRGLAVQWGTSGIGQLNYGRWSDRIFDSLLTHAAASRNGTEARLRYRVATDRLESEAPAIFLFAPQAVMGLNTRVQTAGQVDPFDWSAGVVTWTKRARTVRNR